MESLVIPATASDRLLAYLDTSKERMAFLLAAPDPTDDRWTVIDEMYLDDDTDYVYQGLYGMELADDVRPRVLQWASRPDICLVEVHSHGALSGATTFSPTDLDGLAEVVPQMVWRLRGQPYVAVVLGQDDLDALTWSRRGEPPTVPGAVVLGDRTLTPTGLALDVLTVREDTR